MTQREQMLQMLQDAGERGVHTFEARRAFIGNPSQRIAELESEGHRIFVGPRERLNGKAHGVRYWLASALGPGQGPSAARTTDPNRGVDDLSSGAADGQLFSVPPSSPYGSEAA